MPCIHDDGARHKGVTDALEYGFESSWAKCATKAFDATVSSHVFLDFIQRIPQFFFALYLLGRA